MVGRHLRARQPPDVAGNGRRSLERHVSLLALREQRLEPFDPDVDEDFAGDGDELLTTSMRLLVLRTLGPVLWR